MDRERQVLTALSLNARAGYTELASALGVSRQVVRYTLEKLERKKILESYYALVNIAKLGYLYHRIFLRFRNVTPEDVSQIIDYFSRHKKVAWVCQYEGAWDLAVAVWTKSIAEFEEAWDETQIKLGRYIEDKLISVTTRMSQLKCKFLLAQRNTDELLIGGEPDDPSLDATDYDLLGILTKTARKSYREMGDTLRVSPKVVKYRVRRLLEAGVILGFDIKLNHRLLGYTHHKIFLGLTNISKASIAELTHYLRELSSTTYITKSIGVADLEFELMVRDSEELHTTLRQVRYRFPKLVKSCTSMVVSYEPYVNYLPVKK